MKIFYIPTAIVIGLFFSYVCTGFCHGRIRVLTETLNGMNQLENYKEIRKGRGRNFLIGLIVGIICGIFYWGYSNEEEDYYKIVKTLLILLLVPMVVYMLIPKSKYFLETVKTIKETKEWFDIYKCMQRSMLYGFFIFFCTSLIVLYFIEERMKS
jgi:MFS family permease